MNGTLFYIQSDFSSILHVFSYLSCNKLLINTITSRTASRVHADVPMLRDYSYDHSLIHALLSGGQFAELQRFLEAKLSVNRSDLDVCP